MKYLRLYIFLCFAIMLGVTYAQEKNVCDADSENNDSIVISLVTCYPGNETYELYGHTALRVKRGMEDMVYNYGLFSFNEPNFVYRFVKGDAHYILGAYPFFMFLPEYEQRGSKVVEQVLNLDQKRSKMLYDMLVENAKPENCSYRYNYVYDNCSTRPRDLIEKTIGNTLKYPASKDSTLTFRKEMRLYDEPCKWQQFGIDLALGSGLDYPLTAREQMFLPVIMMEMLDGAHYVAADGSVVPVVARKNVLADGAEYSTVPGTPWNETPMAFALVLLIVTIVVTVWDIRRGKVTKIYDTLLYTTYALGGCIIFFLIFVSVHAATSPNIVGVWLNPFCFVPAIFIWIKSAKKFLYFYHFANFATLLMLLLSWNWLPQVGNAAFIPLIACSATRSLNFMIIYRRCVKKGK